MAVESDEDEDTLALQIAEKALNFAVYFERGKLRMDLCGESWRFPRSTDAQAIDEMSKIWNSINDSMWDHINTKVVAWVERNKANFN